MTSTTQIIYQPYVAGARGSLKAGVAVACRTPEEGIQRAEAEVVRVTHDAAADEMGEPEYLGKFGRTPAAD